MRACDILDAVEKLEEEKKAKATDKGGHFTGANKNVILKRKVELVLWPTSRNVPFVITF